MAIFQLKYDILNSTGAKHKKCTESLVSTFNHQSKGAEIQTIE